MTASRQALTVHPILEWGLTLIRGLQQHRPEALDPLFRLLTAAGSGESYLLILIPITLWCIRRDLGLTLLAVFAISATVNSELKELFQLPRPFTHDAALQLVRTSGLSLPSGDAQNAAAVWGVIAATARRPAMRVSALAAVFIFGALRVYLGVHYPTDVAAGWLVGCAIASVMIGVGKLPSGPGRWSPEARALALAVAMTSIALAIRGGEVALAMTAMVLAACVGHHAERTLVRHRPKGRCWRRGSLWAVAILPASALLLLQRLVVSSSSFLPTVEHTVYGLWLTLVVPLVAVRLGVMSREGDGDSDSIGT